jgi:RNA-directed DNA polymerase
MNPPPEDLPPPVPARAQQGGEPGAPKVPAEPAVWTERMLMALVTGLKGNRWFRLIDKVFRLETLQLAWEKVQSNAGGSGVDGITVGRFAKDCPSGLLVLKKQLQEATYQPKPVKRVWISKLGSTEKRPLGIPVVRDRIVQTSLRMVIEPIFEAKFAEHSYGFRPGRGCKDALRRVQHLLEEGGTWVVDADLKSYFDTIPKDRLMSRVEERIADGRVLALIRSYLDQGVMEDLRFYEAGEDGTPQGAVISPLLANIYLNPLDHLMAESGCEMVRYADDFVILCRSREAAEAALARVQTWVQENGLKLHPEKTRIVDATQKGGFDFLGYHFERDYRWPRKKSLAKLEARVRELTPRRTCGQSLEQCIDGLNEVLRGWYGYFKYSHWTTFKPLDKYVRGRLRSILRNRAGQRGRGRGKDHQKWPIHYFTKRGLFSLIQAHAEALVSLRKGATH